MKTPVAFIIFNRPDTTEKVFEAIRQVQPPKLLVIADGPRVDRPGEAEKCGATRAIIDRVDWDCEVLKNYSDVNLGCGLRPATGISWVFEQVEEAIILEDDCLPHPSFFHFCDALLEKYRDDRRIMNISGSNFQLERRLSNYSYYFSRYPQCWGWASWRRAWQYFDYKIELWPEIKNGDLLENCLDDERAVKFWRISFDDVYNQSKSHIWDYQWIFSCLIQNGLSIVSNVNLISNIGFGAEATHTTSNPEKSPFANVLTEGISFPLKHPDYIISDVKADKIILDNYYYLSLVKRLRWKINRMLKNRNQ